MASKKSYLYLTYSTRNECAGYREFFVLICQPSKRQRTDLLARFTRAVLYVLAKTQGLQCILLAEINPWMKNSVLFRRSFFFPFRVFLLSSISFLPKQTKRNVADFQSSWPHAWFYHQFGYFIHNKCWSLVGLELRWTFEEIILYDHSFFKIFSSSQDRHLPSTLFLGSLFQLILL